MIKLLYAELDALPKTEEMEKSLPERFRKGYFDAHPKASRAGIAGLYLAARAGACGTLVYDEKGRPCLSGDDWLDLSISHTAGFVFCGLAKGEHYRIGIDAEGGGRVSEESMKKIAKRFFLPEEQRLLAEAPNLREAFLELWTKKEAYAKYRGDGLSALIAGKIPSANCSFSVGKVEGLCVAICTDHPILQGFPTPERVDLLVKKWTNLGENSTLLQPLLCKMEKKRPSKGSS